MSVNHETKTISKTPEAAEAYAWLKERGSLPDLYDKPCYDPHSGWTYPFSLFVLVLGHASGTDNEWVIQAAEEKGWQGPQGEVG